ncbi:MAG: hypothetical protein IJJ69_13750 [Oscillospiraceae bacterium]|nr:hypothetical protein [Oscillospiraceae bacterium]
MKLRELRTFSVESLKGQRKTAWFMAISYPAVWLIMKAIPDCMAGALILRKEAFPADIFFSHGMFWMAFVILWNVLRFCILTPMLCSICGWFSCRLGFGRKKQFFGSGKLYWKSLLFFGKIEIIRFLMLFPFAGFCWFAEEAFAKSVLSEDAGIWLFLTIQCIVGTFWTGIFYLRFCVNLLAVPFLFLENPEISAWKAVMLSGKILERKHHKLYLIFCTGLFPARTVMMMILYLQIRIREFFQEQQKYLTFS